MREGMNDQPKFRYKLKDINFEENVCIAYQKFCVINKKYPRIIGVPVENAGYLTPLMEVRIDRNLPADTIWMSL
jgi:hypothetical protein